MIEYLKEYKWFLIPSLIWWVLSLFIALTNDKGELHLFINQFNHPILDSIFKYITHLGDGVFAVAILLIILWFSLKQGIVASSGFVGSTLITQFLKRFVFDDVLRPSKFFLDQANLHLIPGVDLHTSFSFPSGHSTAAFAIFTCLALIVKKSNYHFVFFLVALFAAFSRVYLSQHFLIDISVGSIIGTTSVFLGSYFLRNTRIPTKGIRDYFKGILPQ